MNKILSFLLLVIFLISSCTKVVTNENDEQIQQAPMSAGYIANGWTTDVDVQIEWVAKGMTHYVQNRSFVNVVHTIAEGNDFEQAKMQEIEDQYYGISGISFQLSHNDSVQTNFTPNSYNFTFLPAFVLGAMAFINHIYIPEVTTVDSTLPQLIVPLRVWEIRQQNDVTGFFIDTTGSIDSVKISGEDPPVDQYYIWVIGYDTDPAFVDTTREFPEGISSCGDSICDKFRHEDDSTHTNYCPGDCPDSNAVYNYHVIVESIQIYRDESQYFESWLNGKYEMTCKGATIRDSTVLDYFGDVEDEFNLLLDKIKRKNVCRVSTFGHERGCPGALVTVNKEIFNYFNPLTDSLFFVVYEQNKKSRNRITFRLPGKSANNYPKTIGGVTVPWPQFPCWFVRNESGFNPYYTFISNNVYYVPQESYGTMIPGTNFLSNNLIHILNNGEYEVVLRLVKE